MKTYDYHDRALVKAKFDTGVKGENPLELSPQMQAGIMRLVQKKTAFQVTSFDLYGRRVNSKQLDASLLNRGLIEKASDPEAISYWSKGRYRKVTKKGRHVAKVIWDSVKDESAQIRKEEKEAREKRDEAEGVARGLRGALADSGIWHPTCRKSYRSQSTELTLSMDQARALTKVLRGEK